MDASVVVKLFLPEALSDRADSIFAARTDPGRFHAPDLLYAECANILWKHVRRGALESRTAAVHMNALLNLRITAAASQQLAAPALALAIEHDITAYDATYVALAHSLACELVTADERLVNRLSPTLPFVRWLGGPEPETLPP